MAHILLVDDDVFVLEALKLGLEEKGHTVTAAEHGNAGMKAVNQESFDLVITDLIMPEKEGMEFLIEIKEKYPSLKVIVVSGGGRISASSYLDTAKTFGADDILAKPFSMSEMNARINQVLRESNAL